MTTALRILLIPVVLVGWIAFNAFEAFEEMPFYARTVWLRWRANTHDMLDYMRTAFHLKKENANG